MSNHKKAMKWQRYEVKYLISEAQAVQIRRWCLEWLSPDPYTASSEGHEYPILSTYLDSSSRILLRTTLDKHNDRYKLRVRTYRNFRSSSAGLPYFFEIKRKADGIVYKTRARVTSEIANTVLWDNHFPSAAIGRCDDTQTITSVHEFQRLRDQIGARPAIGVFYMREAYEGVSAERTRITMDRNLHYGILSPRQSSAGEMWFPARAGGVILEVKFTNTYPFWVLDMLRRLEIIRCGVCKYVICSTAAGMGTQLQRIVRQSAG